jgi:hypothetical protein
MLLRNVSPPLSELKINEVRYQSAVVGKTATFVTTSVRTSNPTGCILLLINT